MAFQSIGRSAAALLAGIITVIVLSVGTDVALHASGIFPASGLRMSDALFALAATYRTIYGILGGYIVARLAPYSPMKHALLSGVLGMIAGTIGAVSTWNSGPEFGPHWYPLTLIATALPGSWAGAALRAYGSEPKSSIR